MLQDLILTYANMYSGQVYFSCNNSGDLNCNSQYVPIIPDMLIIGLNVVTKEQSKDPWSWVLSETPAVAQPLKRFMKPKGSLNSSQEPATEAHGSTTLHPLSLRSIFILFFHLRIVLPSVFFLQLFLPISCMYSP
jgi:hypothetical protein